MSISAVSPAIFSLKTMTHRLIAMLMLCLLSMSAAWAEPYNEDRFKTLQAQNKLILVEVNAPWCPVCQAQQKVLKYYQRKNPDSGLHVLTIDFDTQKDLVRQFRAPRQSALFLYAGADRVWFSVGEKRTHIITGQLEAARELLK